MSVLFLLASLGAVNGFMLGIYLIARKRRRLSDLYFGGLILALSIRIGKSVLFYFDRDTDLLILQIGLSACIFIGPFFYLFIKSLKTSQPKPNLIDRILLIGLLVVITITGLLYPYRTEPEVWNTYIVQGIYIVWALFVVFGLYQSRELLIKAIKSPRSLDGKDQYLLGIIVSTIFVTLTYQFALFIKGLTYIWGSIIFSISFYYLAGRAFISSKSIAPKPLNIPPLENGQEQFDALEDFMAEHKPFISPKLKLDELAQHIGTSRHVLSRVLNEVYPSGFSHYIKEHRVKEAQELIRTRNELSLEGIGFEAGFNSKSSFFEAFKLITGQTPASYKKSLNSDTSA